MAEPKKKPAPPADAPIAAPPKFIRLQRGGVVWQNTLRWPTPPNAEALPFRVGDIFREDDESWIVFGMPDPRLTDQRLAAKGEKLPENRAFSTMGDVTDLVLVAWIPVDPQEPIAEAFVSHASAASMFEDLQKDALAAWLGDGEDDGDEEKPPVPPVPQLAEATS